MKRLFKKYGLWGLTVGWLLLSFAVVCPYFCPQAQAREISAHCVSHDQGSQQEESSPSNDGVCCDHSFDVLIQTSSVDHASTPHLLKVGIQPIQLGGDVSDFSSVNPQISSYFTFSPQSVTVPLHLLNHVLLN